MVLFTKRRCNGTFPACYQIRWSCTMKGRLTMRKRWALPFVTLCLAAPGALAGGFGFSLSGATVVNNDINGNGKAEVGDSFSITGAIFSNYRAFGGAPTLDDNDLNRYSATINGTAVAVDGNTVEYNGTFSLVYNGPVLANEVIERGTLKLRAAYGQGGAADVTGVFTANPGAESTVAPFNTTDFAPYNTGRFFGKYLPAPGGATGTLSANLNAGNIGFATSLHNAVLTNNDANGNGKADVNETFLLTAGISTYFTNGGPPLTDNDLNLYSFSVNGLVAAVNGNTVTYTGTYELRYKNPAATPPVDELVENGTMTLTAVFGANAAGGAKLTGNLIANAGTLSTLPPFDQTDFAIFNPGEFHGTYVPTGTGATGIVSGSLIGGVMGFSSSIAAGTVNNNDANGNGKADVGETFTMSAPLAAYMAVGAPPLTDKDLNRYTVQMSGTANAVNGTTVDYTGTFQIIYTNPGVYTAVMESGAFTMTAVYDATGAAQLTGALTAKAGPETTDVPFDQTDYAPFNPAAFSGTYKPVGNGSVGVLHGGLTGGSLVPSIRSRKVGTGIAGSPTAARSLAGAKYAAVVSNNVLYVVDPATGDDAPGWAGGSVLDGRVFGRPVVFKDLVYVGTEAGSLLCFNLLNGSLVKSITWPSGRITSTPATVEGQYYGLASDVIVVSVDNLSAGTTAIVKLDAATLSVVNSIEIPGVSQGVSPAVFRDLIFAGTSSNLTTLRFGDMAVQTQVATPVTTSPLVVRGFTILNDFDGTGPVQGNGGVIFRQPSFSGSTSAQLNVTTYNSTTLSTDFATSGTKAVKVAFQFVDNDPNRWLRLTTSGANPVIDAGQGFAFKIRIEPADPAQGADPLGVAIGVRETVYATDPAIGSNGGATGSIEWIGASGVTSGAPNTTRIIQPGAWYDVVFNIPAESYAGFTGNGVLAPTFNKLTLEHIAFRSTGSSKPVNVYIDDVRIVATNEGPGSVSVLTFVGTGDGSNLTRMNSINGNVLGSVNLGSPLMASAFYESRTNLVQAGLADGRIPSFFSDGSFAGYTLPGLFNETVTGGSQTMPVLAKGLLYRGTNNKQLVSGIPLNGDSQEIIDLVSAPSGALGATGQTPGEDFIVTASPDGYLHTVGIR